MSDKLIEQGIYTIPEAARLVEAPMAKVRGWIAGYKAPPILSNEIQVVERRIAMSFTNLMEVRFIHTFSNLGVKVGSIRAMLEEAKQVLKHPHPFATNTVFKTDGKNIFASIAKQTDDKALYDLKRKNWAFHEIIAQSLMKGVEFDPHGDAVAFWPRKHEAPNVVVRPSWSFGKPVLEDVGIPTRTLYEAFQAEDETEESVARWFQIPRNLVHEAVRFETLLVSQAA